MRSDALIAARAAPASTLVRAWVVTRRDGRTFGFTEHDRPLTVAGVLCPPSSSLSGPGLSPGRICRSPLRSPSLFPSTP